MTEHHANESLRMRRWDKFNAILVILFSLCGIHGANINSEYAFISDFIASAKTPSLVVLGWKYNLSEISSYLSLVTNTTENTALPKTKPMAFRVQTIHITDPCHRPPCPQNYTLTMFGPSSSAQTHLSDDLRGSSTTCDDPMPLPKHVVCTSDSGACTYYFDKLECGTFYTFQLAFRHPVSKSTVYTVETSHRTFPCIYGVLFGIKTGVYSALLEYHHYLIPNSSQAPHDIVLRYSRDTESKKPEKQIGSFKRESKTFCSLYDYPGPSPQFSILSKPQKLKRNKYDLGVYTIYSISLSNLAPYTNYSYQIYAPYGDRYIYAPGFSYFSATTRSRYFSTLGGPPDPPSLLSVDVAGPRHITISWKVSERNGGASVYYLVEYRNGSNAEWERENVTDTKILINQGACTNCQFSASVAAANRFGRSNFVAVTRFRKKPDSRTNVLKIIAGTVSFGVIMSFLTVLSILVYRRHRQRKLVTMIADFECERHQIILPRELECLRKVNKENITVSRELGEGNFGKVFDGFVSSLEGPDSKALRAAFKTLRINASIADRNELLEEALTMRNLDHPNIIKLLGLCVDGTELWLILEMMDGGDLLTLLRESRPAETMPSHVSLDNLLRIGGDIARGCEYISSMGYIHRDLATRNCLVDNRDPDVCTVKIADFGLTRGVYKKCYYRLTENSIFPIRWTAPEVLKDFAFSPRSDVWSFGILLWEIMTLGQHPYQEFTDIDVIKVIKDSKLLPNPDHCPQNIFNIMKSCWTTEPENRPGFTEVFDTLHQIRHIQSGNSTNKPYMLSFKRQREEEITASGIVVAQLPPILSDTHSEVLNPVLKSSCIYRNFSGRQVPRAKRVKGATVA